MAAAEIGRSMGDFDDIIALKLRKPKKWNWQLSTSKSSPHISLPIIQLYDYKGNLLLETKDSGAQCQRRSWHSGLFHDEKQSGSLEESKFGTSHSERSCSDKRDVPTTNKQEGSISRREKRRSDKNNNDFGKTSPEKIDVTDRKAPQLSGTTDAIERNSKQNEKKKTFVDRFEYRTERKNYLRKSESDPPAGIGLSTIKDLHHRRTRSDDAFKRKMKYNEDGSLGHSELDGYQNFVYSEDRLYGKGDIYAGNDKLVLDCIKQTKNSPIGGTLTPSSGTDNDSEIIQPTIHPRYKTRTCSAGTLIISEESFNKPNRRKRLERKNTSADMTSAKVIFGKHGADVFQPNEDTDDILYRRRSSTLNSYRISFPATDEDNASIKSIISHVRQKSDPLLYELRCREAEPILTGQYQKNNDAKKKRSKRFISKHSSHSPSRILETSEDAKPAILGKALHQQQHRKKKRRKIQRQRCQSDGSTSSNADNAEWKNRDEEETSAAKAFIKPKQSHTDSSVLLFGPDVNHRSDGAASAADLFDLVRHLSSQADHHVTMGANVSRHSSKGLSGRRSQSSGSICNGKGKHSEGKSCGSLPSYLDERDSGGCNNNHDYDRPHDEDPRIPPLGDGAPLHWKFSDTQTALCDQGYGSERSPEEEYPPPLPEHDNPCHHHEHHHLEPHACYPFITPESTFLIKLSKGSRGLGLSVTGGIDSGGSWPGLIRIKRLFPHQPASQCGLINVGDLLLEANGITLTGLTNYEALEVLRTASNQVELRICRPPPDVLTCVSPISEVPPPPPRREAAGGPNTPPLAFNSPEDDYYHGEFEIIIMKIQGSLGFTLRKEDDSALGHYVRALVREPALTDGRIKAGDKIIAVNDVEISPMSHEQAVLFLRQCGEEVKLRLYRDAAQTPVAALSPTETTPRTSFSRKSNLRQEAVDMLNDIAVRKLIPGHDEGKGPDQGRANDSFGQGPASMPHIPLENSSAGFSYKNPAYQTAHPPCVTDHEEHLPIKPAQPKHHVDDDPTIRKWKGVMLEEEPEEPIQKTSDFIKLREENEILAIELNRGWNSRLGFSLQGAAGVTYVSAVYADSVAAKDGRLKPGDRVIRVNDESVEHLSTSEIIDLLRIVRGPVCIVVSRTNSKEDCLKSNAAN